MMNNVKKYLLLTLLVLSSALSLCAQGLRHSVCIIEPEFTESERAVMANYSLFMARAGMKSASLMLSAYKNEGTFGSGVLIEHNNKKYILTNLHVVGYAQTATIRFQLHDKNIRYDACPVVSTADKADLALIALPADCEMVDLPFYEGEVTEEQSIVAAGFPELANKPSWQLTRGYISNAWLETDESIKASHVIQHTASIDPGSSGGPLLVKGDDGKYRILGINTWKAFYREGVGLAIATEDILSFLAESPKNTIPQDIKAISMTGEEWLYALRKLPEETQKEIKEMDWHMPLDQALKVLAVRDSIVETNPKNAKHFEKSATHIVTDMEHTYDVRLFYDNYLGMNMQPGIQFGYDCFGFMAIGVQFSSILVHAMTEDEIFGTKTGYKLCPGYMFGLFLGGQIPFTAGKYILAPRIVQSASAGPQKTGNIDGGFAIMTDTRIGLDWRIPYPSCDLIVGAHYDMNWIWSHNELQMKLYKSGNFNQYLQHGIGVSIGIAW